MTVYRLILIYLCLLQLSCKHKKDLSEGSGLSSSTDSSLEAELYERSTCRSKAHEGPVRLRASYALRSGDGYQSAKQVQFCVFGIDENEAVARFSTLKVSSSIYGMGGTSEDGSSLVEFTRSDSSDMFCAEPMASLRLITYAGGGGTDYRHKLVFINISTKPEISLSSKNFFNEERGGCKSIRDEEINALNHPVKCCTTRSSSHMSQYGDPFDCYARKYSENRESELVFKGFDLLALACEAKAMDHYIFKDLPNFPYERFPLSDFTE